MTAGSVFSICTLLALCAVSQGAAVGGAAATSAFDHPSWVNRAKAPSVVDPQAFNVNPVVDDLMGDSQMQLVLDLDVLRQLWQFSPERAKEALMRNDRGFFEKLQEFFKTLGKARDISAPCIADLVYYTYSAIKLITARTSIPQCYNNTYCDTECLTAASGDAQRRLWVLSVLDAMGKFQSGVLDGNILFHGAYDECLDISAVKSKQGLTWQGKYCQAYVYPKDNPFAAFVPSTGAPDQAAGTCSAKPTTTTGMPTTTTPASSAAGDKKCFKTLSIMTYGACMPDSCTNYDVSRFFHMAIDPIQTRFGANLACEIEVDCHEKDRKFREDGVSIGVLAFFVVIVAFVLFGSLYDYYSYRVLIESYPEADVALEAELYREQSWFAKVLLAFSVYTNGKAILKTDQRPGQIHCIHGIRVLSMLWIIIGHTYYYMGVSGTLDNLVSVLFNFPLSFTNQIILNAPLGVDTFFFISGLLVTYLWMRATQKMKAKNIKSGGFWFNYYFHRYLRLTPVYMVVLAFHVTLLYYVSDGPQWRQINAERCENTWWLNPLYINNLVKSDDPYTCVGWSWYLANDMQFYVLCPIFLVLLWSYQWVGIGLCVVALIAAGVGHSLIINAGDYPPSPTLTTKIDLVLKLQEYWPDVYVKPWVRCSPYLVGIVVGYILWRSKLRVNMKWYVVIIGWVLSWAVGLAVVFGLYNYSYTGEISDAGRYLYATFARTAYAMTLGWLVFACATGYGGPINTLLSWKVWMPLSRLTYCAYLIHPMIIQAYMLSRKVPFHFGHHYQILIHFFAITISSYAIGFLVSLAFEVPVSHIESIVRTSLPRKSHAHKIDDAPPSPLPTATPVGKAYDPKPQKGIIKKDGPGDSTEDGDGSTTTTATVHSPDSGVPTDKRV